MKIAVICVGYLGSARGVELLAGYFSGADADIWLHVDSATDAIEYQALVQQSSHIRFVSPRLRCWWGGFNGARAVLAVAAAAQAEKHYDRYIYLTEDSVPLRSVDQMIESLSGDQEFIAMSGGESVRARYAGFYCWDCDAMNPRCATYEDWIVTPELERQITCLSRLRARGKASVPRLWHGGAYWALSANAMAELLRRHQTDDHLRESFEFSAIPEEQYYHTILGESSHGVKTTPFLFMDFTKDPRPFVYRTRKELGLLQAQQQYLFARKVDFHSPQIAKYFAKINCAPSVHREVPVA